MPTHEEVPGLARHEREEAEAVRLAEEEAEIEAMRHEYNLYEGRPDPDDW